MAKLTECTFYIDGMHCASCEVLIEKKLLKQPGVEYADASLKDNSVIIQYSEAKPNVKELNADLQDLGYQLSHKKFALEAEPPLFNLTEGGGLAINMAKLKKVAGMLAVALGLIVAFFVFESMQLGQYVSVDASSSLAAFFMLGLVAGFSSCAALVGGLLLSMVKQWNEMYIDADSVGQKFQPHTLFHVGRIISFAALGAVLGLIGEAISLNNTAVYAILTVVVSAIMFILALQMLGVEWAQKIRLSGPKSLGRYASSESNFTGKYMPVVIGAMTFFLPCGFTLIAQSLALTSGSAIQGAMIMMSFALGTFIPLLGISLGGVALNSKPHLTARFNAVAGLVIIFFALYNVNGQLNVLGFPSLSDIRLGGGQASEGFVVQQAGAQELNITAEGFEYIPTGSTKLKAGVPTTLVVNNKGIQGCATFIAAQGLINNFVPLKAGVNRIDLGSPRAGTYKLTCSMGMVRPVTITVI